MDEQKSRFDEIMEQLSANKNSANMHPKKLNFEYINDSLETASAAKKRRYSDLKMSEKFLENHSFSKNLTTTEDDSVKHHTSIDSLNNTSASNAPSPWEQRRLKADLLEAKSLIVKLKQEIEQQHNIKAYTEEMYNNKVEALIKQCEFTSNKVIDLEKHLTAVRKREKEAKTELVTVKNQIVQQKQMYEEKLYNLQKQYNEYEENTRTKQNQLQNELSELKRQNDRLRMEYDLNRQELDNLKMLNKEYKDKAGLYDQVVTDLEFAHQENDKAKSRIKQLEHELSSYGDWKDLTKKAQSRLMNLSDLEKEVQRLRNDNKNLRDSMGNKLLLEEQVYDLRSRLEKYDKSSSDLATLKVQIKNLEDELNDWRKLAEDHLPKNQPISSIALRLRLEQLLQKDIIMTSEKGLTQNEREQYQDKINELQKQNEIYVKANSDVNLSMKRQKNITLRVQKKLMIVVKERNFYKQLVENFEKDLTISGAMLEAINNPPDSQLKARLDILEKSLAGYKEMCSNLQKELESINVLSDIPLETPINTESYDRLRKEIETLRVENDRLRRRKEELELEMEQRCLKGDFNIERYKILHMTNNPANEAYEKHQNEMEKLQAEIERLKRKIRRLEDERDEIMQRSTTTTMNTTATNNITMNIKEMNQLRTKLESMESKMQHMKDIYKTASIEFREVCYMLFGYRVDRMGNGNYRISSMYAENENEYMNFHLSDSGSLDMLETEYSMSLGDLVKQHLIVHKSLPAFLSTLTLELFNKITIYGSLN